MTRRAPTMIRFRPRARLAPPASLLLTALAAFLIGPEAPAAPLPGMRDPAAVARAAEARAARLERSSRFTPPAPRMAPVLSGAAVERLAGGRRAALWVFFTDKALADRRAFEAARTRAGERLTERARARRAREQGGRYTPDFDDVPVPPTYVEAVASTGARIRHASRWLNAVSVEAGEGEARRIAALPFVRAVLPVRYTRGPEPVEAGAPVPGAPAPGDGGRDGAAEAPDLLGSSDLLGSAALPRPTLYGPSVTQLTGINAIAAHDSGWSGAGVLLAMFDTGYNKGHNATIQLKRIAEWDFVWEDGETANQAPDPTSQWDHGTGTWAVAGGYWINNLIGPAYNATFALAKTEWAPTETHAEEDNWVAAAEWSDSLGVDVISSSLAYLDFDSGVDYTYADLDGHTTIVAQGALLAHRRGILVATATGNSGPLPGSLHSPSDADSILSCGAVTSANGVASFSGRGPTFDGRIKPEVVAQGVATYWAVAGNNASIAPAQGTSLSTPLVAGAAALVREAHPEWTVAQLREALMATADSAATPDNDRGWGRVNTLLAIYASPHGAPVFPKPFDLLAPPHNGGVSATPVTLRWRRTTDPDPGDQVTYTVTLRRAASGEAVFSQTTTDSFAVVSEYLGPSTTYEWSVVATDLLGHARAARQPFRFTTGATTDVAIPPAASGATLGQNRPNPGFRATDIPYTLEGTGAPQPASLRIFDAQGRLVRTLIDSEQPTARQYVVRWDGRDDRGHAASAGVYFYELRAAGRTMTRRLVLLR